MALLESSALEAQPPADQKPGSGTKRPVRRAVGARRADNVTAYLMIAPMVILLGIFVMWPLVYSGYLSMFKINFYQGSKFVGAQFYKDVLTSSDFYHSLWIGLYYALLVVPIGIILALLLAAFIKTLSKRVAAVMKVTVYLPAVVSTVIASVLFTFMYQDDGVVNWFLSFVNHAPIAWLNSPQWALPAIAVPGIWLGFGITTLIMLAAMLDIPESYYESAMLDGANFFQRLFRITLPLLRNVMLYLVVTGFAISIQMVDLPLIMTGGGPIDATTTPNYYIFNQFKQSDPYSTSYSLTASLLLFVVLGTISILIFRLIRSDKAVDG